MARSIGANNQAEIVKHSQWPIELIEMVIDPANAAARIRYTNLFHEITFDGNVYTPAGAFLSISAVRDDLHARDDDLNITLSGVSPGVVALMQNYEIAGSPVKIHRGFYDENTGNLVEDPYLVWDGIASSWGVEDDNKFSSGDAVVVTIECRSTIEALLGRKNGMFTSIPSVQRYYSPTVESNARNDLKITFTTPATDFDSNSTISGFSNNLIYPGDSGITGLVFSNSQAGCSIDRSTNTTQELCTDAGGAWTVADNTIVKSGVNVEIRTSIDDATNADKITSWEDTINGSTSLGFTASQASGELLLTPKDFDQTFDSSSVSFGDNDFSISLTDVTETATNTYREGCFDFVSGLKEKDFHFGRTP